MREVAIVIPCFDEERRLDEAALREIVAAPRVGLVLVDDGSTDGTRAKLERLAAELPGAIEVVALERNVGKGEAIRAGLRHALAAGARAVGFADADMATPPSELLGLVATLEATGALVVLGSRVRRLGASIRRSPSRHYVGRVFATAASLALELPVYDTQCGAKVFRAAPALAAALGRPFSSRWAFDVELLGRLLAGSSAADGLAPSAFVEVPLRAWRDVEGSKVRPLDGLRALVDVALVGRELRRSRR